MLAHSTQAAHRSPRIESAALLAASMVIIMLVTQLFTYEAFSSILSAILPVSDNAMITITTAKIIIIELLALPFLLNMKLSKLMRFLSAVCAIASSIFWFFLVLTNAHTSNSGLFGDTFTLPGGGVAAIWAALLLGSVAYVCMWSMRESQPSS